MGVPSAFDWDSSSEEDSEESTSSQHATPVDQLVKQVSEASEDPQAPSWTDVGFGFETLPWKGKLEVDKTFGKVSAMHGMDKDLPLLTDEFDYSPIDVFHVFMNNSTMEPDLFRSEAHKKLAYESKGNITMQMPAFLNDAAMKFRAWVRLYDNGAFVVWVVTKMEYSQSWIANNEIYAKHEFVPLPGGRSGWKLFSSNDAGMIKGTIYRRKLKKYFEGKKTFWLEKLAERS